MIFFVDYNCTYYIFIFMSFGYEIFYFMHQKYNELNLIVQILTLIFNSNLYINKIYIKCIIIFISLSYMYIVNEYFM